MKKIIILCFCLTFLFSCFSKQKENFLVSEDLAVIEVDLRQQDIYFGGVDITQKEYDRTEPNFIFTRYFAKDFLEKFGTEKTRFVINGQFFDQNKNPTILSFPLKSKGKIISSYMDNTLEKKTLIIDSEKNIFLKEGFKNKWLGNKNYSEVIAGFSPKIDAFNKFAVGRTYIGKKDKHTLIFFIAKGKTQKQMEKIMKQYKITDFLMMDGGPSSQFAWNNNGNIQQYFGKWETPHFFIISEK